MLKLNRREAIALAGLVLSTTMFVTPVLAENAKIKVGALRFTSHSASFVAFERGYFKEAGLDVELKFFQAAQPMAVAIASGDIDYAVTAVSGGLISLAKKGAIKVIGGALSEEPGIDGQKILVSDAAFQAGVKSARDLDGKSFGVTHSRVESLTTVSRFDQPPKIWVTRRSHDALFCSSRSSFIDNFDRSMPSSTHSAQSTLKYL